MKRVIVLLGLIVGLCVAALGIAASPAQANSTCPGGTPPNGYTFVAGVDPSKTSPPSGAQTTHNVKVALPFSASQTPHQHVLTSIFESAYNGSGTNVANFEVGIGVGWWTVTGYGDVYHSQPTMFVHRDNGGTGFVYQYDEGTVSVGPSVTNKLSLVHLSGTGSLNVAFRINGVTLYSDNWPSGTTSIDDNFQSEHWSATPATCGNLNALWTPILPSPYVYYYTYQVDSPWNKCWVSYPYNVETFDQANTPYWTCNQPLLAPSMMPVQQNRPMIGLGVG